MNWKDSKYSEDVLHKAQGSVNRRQAAVVDSDDNQDGPTKPQGRCFQDAIVPGDDGNKVCPEHPKGRCN